MLSKINYTIPFCQDYLCDHIPNNKTIMNKLSNQLKNVSNITQSCKEGICHGLALTFAAYEMHGLGAKSINQLNQCLNPVPPTISHNKNVQAYAKQAYLIETSNLLASRCTDIFNLQMNINRYGIYYELANKNNSLDLPNRLENITDIEYITSLLEIQKKINDDRQAYRPNIEIEKKLIQELYQKIESGLDIPVPNAFKIKPNICKKIQNKEKLTQQEIKLFLTHAYLYCALYFEYEAAIFNFNSGIIHNNDFPPFSHENTIPPLNNITLQELTNTVDYYKKNKQNFALIYGKNCHSMTINGRYNSQKDEYIFSFFEPNDGLIQSNNQSEFLKLITPIVKAFTTLPVITHIAPPFTVAFTYPAIIPFFQETLNPEVIGKVSVLHKSRYDTKQTMLPVLNIKNIQNSTKTMLVNDKITINLQNNSKLTFENYYKENNELTLRLSRGNDSYTIYSELNDIDVTIDLIRASMDEYPKYRSKNIYIDWKGQILNRLSKH
ncbi:hypothetical protein [Providencia vermicola]|uniref:hypothetical protein n=1 Tax=Providencia vermicola TaxID=333965 RepID=UPI0021FF4B68|nr:hypothetical protein NFC79_05750 [Providencia stuartii]